MRIPRSVLPSLFILFLALPVQAATYTVKAGGGGNFATVQACVSAAQPGDTCEVYAGTYSETVSSVRAGTSDNARITIIAHTGDRPVVSRFSLSHSYLTVSGFEVTNTTGMGISGYGATIGIIVENNYIHTEYGTCVQFGSAAPFPTDIIIRNNVITRCGWQSLINSVGSSTAWGISFYGARALIEGNTISHVTDDVINGFSSQSVIRNNHFGPLDAHETGVQSGAHMDGFHVGGVDIVQALFEGNVYQDALDPTGNSHFTWVEPPGRRSYLIIRYNYTNNIEDTATVGMAWASAFDHFYIYSNTISEGHSTGDGFCMALPPNYTSMRAKNNLCYDASAGTNRYPILAAAASPVHETGGNLVYQTGYSGEWSGRYATESTYNTLKNQDPLFANYPTSAALQSGSPARSAGVALTSVAAGDSGSGTTLVVTDAGYFQAGFGPSYAPVPADEIRIGASTVATISSINYATNTITLTAPVSRTGGDPVYLYKKSDGVQVLYGTRPDVGAYPFGTPAPPAIAPAPPTDVRIVR